MRWLWRSVAGRSEGRGRRRVMGRQLAAGEWLEPRLLLASHPGLALDATGTLVAVDPAVQAKLGDLLAVISADYESLQTPGEAYAPPANTPSRELLSWDDGEGIVVTAVAVAGEVAPLADAIESLGGTRIVSHADQVSAWLPFAALDDLAAVPGLRFADAAIEPVANGSLVNQAGLALEADLARARFGVDGSGIRIGVISDSFNNLGGYAFDVASGTLPAGVVVLKENPVAVEDGRPQPGSDEGRAMAQLVHSIAPGASLFFASAGNTPAAFADSIEQLVAAGCEIIVDDITEGGVPWLQDGIVALAVDAAARDAGVTYLTAAGNFGRNGYGSEFRGVAAADLVDLPPELTASGDYVLHDFDPGPVADVFQLVTIPAGTTEIRVGLQWDQPWGANASDVDLFVYAADGQTLLDRLDGSHQTGGNPSINGVLPVPAGLEAVQLVLAHTGGVAPGYVKYLTYHAELEVEHAAGTSTIVAHANSATAAAVGASFYFRTPAYRQAPAELVRSSSRGGTPILFTTDGERLPAAEIRQQPRFVAPNIGDTSFFGQDIDLNGLPNFSGTSAAAPNAAAVAALMKGLDPGLTAEEIFAILGETAGGMPGSGGPLAVGEGLINAERALARVGGGGVSGRVLEDSDRDGLDAADLPLAGATVFLDLNDNGQLDRAPAAGAAPAYVGFEAPAPVAIGIREQIDNPNIPNDGPLARPFTATSPVDVSGLPGLVTDLGVLYTLTSDRVIDDELIGPLFVTLISPAGVRVPLQGTTVFGNGGAASPFNPLPTMLPADGLPHPRLVSQFETPVSEFIEAAGRARLSQVDLAQIVGSDPNGRWQLEVQSDDDDPDRTATLESWELFLETAEPAVRTDAEGGYAFAGLSPASVAGPVRPRLLVADGRSLLAPQTQYSFALGVGEQVIDADFAVTAAEDVVDVVIDIAAGQTVSETQTRSGPVRLVKHGDGRLVLEAANSHSGGIVVAAGEVVVGNPNALGGGLLQVLAGAAVALDVGPRQVPVASLALAPTATLDLASGGVLLVAGGYDLPTVERAITTGRGGGSWDGPGITSTSIAPGSFRAVGSRPLPDGSLVVGYAAVGDATMDGRVNVFDLVAMAASGLYDAPGATAGWWQGDFNDDGLADEQDLQLMAAAGLYDSGPYLPDTAAAMSMAVAASKPPAGSAASNSLSTIQQLAWAAIAREEEAEAASPGAAAGRIPVTE